MHGTTMLQLCEGISKELTGILLLDCLHATPACAWSLDWSTQRPLTSPTSYMQLLRKAAELNQPICLNFDNPYVAKNLLEDDLGLYLVNELLQNNPTKRNAVAVADDRVAMVLRRNFPKLPLIAHMNRSVCEEREPDAAFYNQLLDFYQAVQLYPAIIRNPRELEELHHPERCIVVINDCCRQGSRNGHRDMLLLLAQMRIRPYEFAFKVRRSEQMPAIMPPPRCPRQCPFSPADPRVIRRRFPPISRSGRTIPQRYDSSLGIDEPHHPGHPGAEQHAGTADLQGILLPQRSPVPHSQRAGALHPAVSGIAPVICTQAASATEFTDE